MLRLKVKYLRNIMGIIRSDKIRNDVVRIEFEMGPQVTEYLGAGWEGFGKNKTKTT